MDQSKFFWMVYGDSQGAPTYKHLSPLEARREAERLARLNPGVKFYVLAAVGCAHKIDVAFEEWTSDQIPF